MNKGDETKKGIYLGEVMVDREKALTPEQVSTLPAVYAKRTPPSSPDIFQGRAIAYVFDKDGEEELVLVEDYKE